MEAFLNVAGVVGFVASQDSLINLLNRVGGLLRAPAGSYTEMEQCKFEMCRNKFHKSLEVLGEPAEGDVFPKLYTMCVRSKMEEITRLKAMKQMAFHTGKSVGDLLDETEKLINSIITWKSAAASSSSSSAARIHDHPLMEAEREKMQLLIRLMRPENKQPLRKKELKEKHVLLDARDDMGLQRSLEGLKEEDEDACLSMIHWKTKNYIVERVGFGTNPKEKEKRLTRLGRLTLNMREWEDPCIAKMAFIVEGPNTFYILSELMGSFTFLERLIDCNSAQSQEKPSILSTSGLHEEIKMKLNEGDRKLYLLQNIALAIKRLHDQMVLHEGIGSHNILVGDVQDNALEVKLAGFVSARMVDDMSDRPSHLSPIAQRRRIISQAPWRVAGSRYSFECDVYSFGVLMAEIQCGICFAYHPLIEGRDHILATLHENHMLHPSMIPLIQECMSTQACLVPPINEVLQRLNYMRPISVV